MSVRALSIATAVAGTLALGMGCEKVDHENIDKWSHTSKGPAKLLKAVGNDAVDADLSAHAAANLIKRNVPAVIAMQTSLRSPR